MAATQVVSTAITSIDFDSTEHTVLVEFTSGKRYKYYGVPDIIAKKFMKASSKGTYFGNRIRDVYHCEEVE
jgi:hypothetical protein